MKYASLARLTLSLVSCDWSSGSSCKSCTGPKPMGGLGAERPPADHLSENFALLSEFLCSK